MTEHEKDVQAAFNALNEVRKNRYEYVQEKYEEIRDNHNAHAFLDALENLELNGMLPTYLDVTDILRAADFGTHRSFLWAIFGAWQKQHPDDFNTWHNQDTEA